MNPQEPETSSFPAQYSPPQQIPPQQPPRRDRSGLAMVLLALLFLGAVALGVWMYNAFLRADTDDTAAPPPTTVVTFTPTSNSSAPATTSSERPTTTVTSTSTSTSTSEPAPTTSEAPPPPAYRAPDDAVQCAANVNWRIFRANDHTSCAFAENVAIAMAGNAGDDTAHEVRVNSPVTGQNYAMSCYPQGDNTFICEGGDNAVVILEDRAVRD